METNEKELTGYPSVDKPWLKYYSEEAISSPLPECSAYDYLYLCNKDFLNDTVLEYYGRKITYKQMFENIDKATKAFSALKLKENEIVIIVSITIPETIYAFYALNRIGIAVSFIDPRTNTNELISHIIEMKTGTLIILDLFSEKLSQIVKETSLSNVIIQSPSDSLPIIKRTAFRIKNKSKLSADYIIWNDFINSNNVTEMMHSEYVKDKCKAIIFTGGTTGVPKGVMLSDNNLNAAAFQAKNSPIMVKRSDTFLNVMLPFYAYGLVLGLHTALTCGWKSIIITMFNLSDFTELLIKHKPNAVMGVTSFYEDLIKNDSVKNVDFSFLKAVLVGGDTVSPALENEINSFFHTHNCNIHLSKGYSMTEASATTTISFESANEIGSNGIPLTKTNLGVFKCDDSNTELKYNEVGEICIESPTIMLGYYNKTEETNKIIKTHSDGRIWLHTGDLGYINQNGMLYIQNRIKRIIVRYDGRKVFPNAIESVITKNKRVKACCAVGITDKSHIQGKLPVVYVELKSENTDNNILINELMAMCEKELTEYSMPVDFRVCKSLPLTSVGKIDYRALEKMAEEMQ